MRRVSPKWIHTNHSLLARSKRCDSALFLHHSYTFLMLCLLARQASSFSFLLFLLHILSFSFKHCYSHCMTRSTSSLLLATSVSTVVGMPCQGGRAGKAPPPPRFPNLDPSHQFVESSPTTNCAANPTGNRTVNPSGSNLEDDEITGPGGMVRFCLCVDVC